LDIDRMTPQAALQKQIERYRAMTGEQRLKIALDLHEFSCNVARAGIRRQFPIATVAEVEQELRRRIELSRR
jgi:Rv0078B-related antitoxin